MFNIDNINLDIYLVFISLENSYLEEFKEYIYSLKSLEVSITIYRRSLSTASRR